MHLRNTIAILLHTFSALGIRLSGYLNVDNCKPLTSGTKIHLKSNALPDNHFISIDEGNGDCGSPWLWRDEKRISCSTFRLKQGKSENSTFRIQKEGGGPIFSSDMVNLIADKDGLGWSVDFSKSAWPYAMTSKKDGDTLEITRARDVAIRPTLLMKNRDDEVHEDKFAGKPICDGEEIFVRIVDTASGPQYNGLGYLYLQGDTDKHVGFFHHFPGHMGNPTAVRNIALWFADDTESKGNRFTVIADDETKQ